MNLRQSSLFLASTMQEKSETKLIVSDFYKINLRQNSSFLTSTVQEKSETKLIVSDFYTIIYTINLRGKK